MAAVLALPKSRDLPPDQLAATFVVPAPSGCNLNCSFCFIRMRREALPGPEQLSINDYVRFFEELCRQASVGLLSLQGYEPLLKESWPYSEALLASAKGARVDAALVTNGTLLAGRVADLVRLGVQGVTVSLDSADSSMHDKSRNTEGAFAATLSGLRAASDSDLRERILVASVLQRDKSHYLHGMPKLLSSLGIRHWVITPVYKVGRLKEGGPSDDHDSIVFQLVRLNAIAREHGVQLVVDDEFKRLAKPLEDLTSADSLHTRQLMRFDQVVRLSPQGSCSFGNDILRRADSGVPLWCPDSESAETFIRLLLAKRQTPAALMDDIRLK